MDQFKWNTERSVGKMDLVVALEVLGITGCIESEDKGNFLLGGRQKCECRDI